MSLWPGEWASRRALPMELEGELSGPMVGMAIGAFFLLVGGDASGRLVLSAPSGRRPPMAAL